MVSKGTPIPVFGLLLLLSVITPNLLMAASKPAGKVIIAAGEAYARTLDGEQRPLRRRAEFFAGEVLVTGDDGRLQVRFLDGAMVDLRENTEYRIDDYRYHGEESTGERSVTTLLKGGLRTITGAIGKQNPDAYRMNTPVATIGIRGTHFEAVLADGLVVGVWRGGVQVRNEAGALEIGQGAAFDYLHVASAAQAPMGQIAVPAPLQGRTPVPLPRKAPPAVQSETTGQSGEQKKPGAAPAVAVANTPQTVPSREAQHAPAEKQSTGGELPMATAMQEPAPLPATVVMNEPLGPQPGTLTEPTQLLEPVFSPDPLATSVPRQFLEDQRLSNLERQRLSDDKRIGMLILSGPAPKQFPLNQGPLTGGYATAEDLGPVIATSAADPGHNSFADFLSAGIRALYRPGSVNTLPPPFPVPASPGGTVQWGAWDANPGNPLQVQTDPQNPLVHQPVGQPVFWATAIPASKATLDARSGVGAFNHVMAAFGHASNVITGNAIVTADVTFNANIDFNTGLVSAGQITLGHAPSLLPEQWTVNFTGQLNGPIVNVDPSNISGTVSGGFGSHSVEGELGGIITAPGNVIGGGFSFASQVDGRIHAEGLFVVRE